MTQLPLSRPFLVDARGGSVRLLLTLLAAVLYALGWAAGLVAIAVVWCWSAMAVGWDDARGLARREPVRAR